MQFSSLKPHPEWRGCENLKFWFKTYVWKRLQHKIPKTDPKRTWNFLFFHCCDLERKQLTGVFPSVDIHSDSKNYSKSSLESFSWKSKLLGQWQPTAGLTLAVCTKTAQPLRIHLYLMLHILNIVVLNNLFLKTSKVLQIELFLQEKKKNITRLWASNNGLKNATLLFTDLRNSGS